MKISPIIELIFYSYIYFIFINYPQDPSSVAAIYIFVLNLINNKKKN